MLLAALLTVIWLCGGASRADAMGQAIVRAAAWGSLIVALIFQPRPSFGGVKPVLLLVLASVLIVAVQLVPLPPALWQALSGRDVLAEAANASGQAQPWRSWSMVPGATVNALASLIVPVALLVLVAGIRERERGWLPGMVLGLIAAATLVGLLQFSGAGFNNPFINDAVGEVSGTFANRNHFALFLALGCLVAPAWAFPGARRLGWRAPVTLGLVFLFILTILASGSRAGIVVGLLGLAIGIALAWRGLKRELRRAPRWVLPAILAAVIGTVATLVLISIASGRAVSIDRVLAGGALEDMRGLALPVVLSMISAQFPAGSGWGGFDAVFRIYEPEALLQLQYLNHAHNDFLELALDGGLLALLLLIAAIGWWAVASWRAWRSRSGSDPLLARVGSAMLLLILLASAVDYPARTPMVMAMIVVAATWLSDGGRRATRSALPAGDQRL